MMDLERRYQVFVSSTYWDLTREREEVMQALLELDCIPSGMELFPASNEEKWELIKRVIDDCDYYLVIVGGRYGSTDEDGISYTEREFDYASGRGIPILGFVHAAPDRIEAGKTELSEEAQQRLAAFREKVEKRMCRPWSSAQDLGGAVSRSLVQQMKLNPRTGWVRANQAMSAEVLEELTELRQLNAKLSAELAAPAEGPAPGTEHLAQGEEEFELDYAINEYSRQVGSGTWRYTWNQLLAVLGPLMFDEASESELAKRLGRQIQHDVERDHGEELAEKFRFYSNFAVTSTSFHAIKTQLAALKTIEKSIRKRGVKDNNTYWKLTPYGESVVFTVSAIPTGKTRPTWEDVEDDGDSPG